MVVVVFLVEVEHPAQVELPGQQGLQVQAE
jgi:hypothetical protein